MERKTERLGPQTRNKLAIPNQKPKTRLLVVPHRAKPDFSHKPLKKWGQDRFQTAVLRKVWKQNRGVETEKGWKQNRGVETEPRGGNRTEGWKQNRAPIHSPAEMPHLHISTLANDSGSGSAQEGSSHLSSCVNRPGDLAQCNCAHLPAPPTSPPNKVKVWGKQTGTHLGLPHLEHP